MTITESNHQSYRIAVSEIYLQTIKNVILLMGNPNDIPKRTLAVDIDELAESFNLFYKMLLYVHLTLQAADYSNYQERQLALDFAAICLHDQDIGYGGSFNLDFFAKLKPTPCEIAYILDTFQVYYNHFPENSIDRDEVAKILDDLCKGKNI